MGRLIETVGKYAEVPYYIKQADTSVYCVEELCYVFSNSAFLLDKNVLQEELIKWLEEQCGLADLAAGLYPLLHQQGSPSAFAGIILEYAHYGTKQERAEVENLLRQSADMDAGTKKKNYADFLVGNGRFAAAIREYDILLSEMPSLDHVTKAKLHHNKGVALCRLFDFRGAAEAFLKSLEENPDDELTVLHYLGSLKMMLPPEKYIDFLSEHKMWFEESVILEKRFGKMQEQFLESPENKELTQLTGSKDKVGEDGYYVQLHDILLTKKKKYREMIADI